MRGTGTCRFPALSFRWRISSRTLQSSRALAHATRPTADDDDRRLSEAELHSHRGLFPDPGDTGAGAEGEGLLKRWRRAGYEQRLAEAGEAAEAAFVAAIEEAVRDQVDAGIDVPTDGEVRRENYIFYQCRNLNGIDFDHLTEKVARDGALPPGSRPSPARSRPAIWSWPGIGGSRSA